MFTIFINRHLYAFFKPKRIVYYTIDLLLKINKIYQNKYIKNMKHLALIFRINVLLMALTLLYFAVCVIKLPLPFFADTKIITSLSWFFYSLIIVCFILFFIRKSIRYITDKRPYIIILFTSIILVNLLLMWFDLLQGFY